MPVTPSKVPDTRNGWIVQIGVVAIVLAYFAWFVGLGLPVGSTMMTRGTSTITGAGKPASS